MTKIRIRKTEALNKNEFAAFKKWVSSKPTKIDACEESDLTRPTLDRVLVIGSGHPTTIEKIRKVLNPSVLQG